MHAIWHYLCVMRRADHRSNQRLLEHQRCGIAPQKQGKGGTFSPVGGSNGDINYTTTEKNVLRGPDTEEAWWALGDAPVRIAETLIPLVDGRAAMLAMAVACLTAENRIWVADWDLHAELELVRGRDQRAGEPGTPEQEMLLERLRAAGLDEEAAAFWQKGPLRVLDVLRFAARRRIDVRVLLWDPYTLSGTLRLIHNPLREQQELCTQAAIQCRLDKSSRSIFHVAQALHQKFLTVDGTTAFIGGIDLTVGDDGDFNRWDTPAHLLESADRSTDLGPSLHPWHDVHVRLTGAPVADVEHNFLQRWQEADRPWWKRVTPPLKSLARFYLSGKRTRGQQAAREEEEGDVPRGAGPPVSGAAARVQIIRTIPALTYRFAPAGIYGIAQAYTLALRQAKRFIYLETQYLWLESFVGLNVQGIGWQSHHMRAFMEELAAAAERGVTVALVLPDHPYLGRPATDGTIAWLRKNAPRAAALGRLYFFCLGTSHASPGRGSRYYQPIYVHAKVGIVDDCWATVGSANLNSRGLSHDVELNVAMLDPVFVRGLRLSLWAEHSGALQDASTGWPAPAALPLPRPLEVPKEHHLQSLVVPTALPAAAQTTQAHHEDGGAGLADPLEGLALLAQRADENLERLQRGSPLKGHLLPYLRPEEGEKKGVTVHPLSGWLDPLNAGQRKNTRQAMREGGS